MRVRELSKTRREGDPLSSLRFGSRAKKRKGPGVYPGPLMVVDGLLPNNLLLGAMSDAAGDWARATGQGHTFTWSRTLFNGEKSGAASFISAIIASSTYFSAMSGEMTMP